MPHALRRPVALAATLAGSLVMAAGLQSVTPSAEAANATNGRPTAPGGVALTWSPAYMTDSHAFTAADATDDGHAATTWSRRCRSRSEVRGADARRPTRSITPPRLRQRDAGQPDRASGLPEEAFAHDAARQADHRPELRHLPDGVLDRVRGAPPPTAMCDDRSAPRRLRRLPGRHADPRHLLPPARAPGSRSTRPPARPTPSPSTRPADDRSSPPSTAPGSPGLIHIGNSVENAYRYWQTKVVTSQALATSQPGAQMEDFLRGASNPVSTSSRRTRPTGCATST